MSRLTVILMIVSAAFLAAVLSAPRILYAGEAPGAVSFDSTGAPASGAPAAAVSGAQSMPAPESNEFPVTLDEVKTLLARGETPRLRVANKFGGVVTGRAVRLSGDQLSVDVSGEGVGIDGIIGVPVSAVISIRTVVPFTNAELDAARKATADYLAGIGARAAAVPEAQGEAQPEPESSAPSLEAPAITAIEGEIESTGPAEGEGPQEGERDLLVIYPPSEGWGPQKLADIIRKSVVLHLHPFGKDQEFMNDYDAWKSAYEAKRAQQVQELEALQASGKPIPPDFTVLPELPPLPSLEGTPSAPSAPAGDESAAPAAGEPAPSAEQ